MLWQPIHFICKHHGMKHLNIMNEVIKSNLVLIMTGKVTYMHCALGTFSAARVYSLLCLLSHRNLTLRLYCFAVNFTG
jgi:hypothetical protein